MVMPLVYVREATCPNVGGDSDCTREAFSYSSKSFQADAGKLPLN
jgi:hypothetical protein